jgi:hypothetical protein
MYRRIILVYSKTCLQQPFKGPRDGGLCRQVVLIKRCFTITNVGTEPANSGHCRQVVFKTGFPTYRRITFEPLYNFKYLKINFHKFHLKTISYKWYNIIMLGLCMLQKNKNTLLQTSLQRTQLEVPKYFFPIVPVYFELLKEDNLSTKDKTAEITLSPSAVHICPGVLLPGGFITPITLAYFPLCCASKQHIY